MNRLEACEIETTGMCPLDCAYCYIPKTTHMGQMHKEIVKRLESGEFMDIIEKVYGKNLTSLGFWGTEPTLTLPLLTKQLPELVRRFPKFRTINYSTANMLNPAPHIELAKALEQYPIALRIQTSIDGPEWITDKNRKGGAVKVIIENLEKMIEGFNNVNTKVELRWKATHGLDNIRNFVENPEKMDQYDKFFRDLNTRLIKQIKNKKLSLATGSYVPTLVVPGKYTSEDGKWFCKYQKMLLDRGYETTYTHRLLRLFHLEKELQKRSMMSCSGGDSNLGLGIHAHICHRTFYFDNEKYVDSILEQKDIDNWDVSLFKKGTIDHINRNFIVDPYDDHEWTRFLYVMRGYHSFWKFQLGYVEAMLKELALAGQADPIYLEDDRLCALFGLFMNAALSCPMENLLNTGSIHLQVVSLIRLFSNGAFQIILDDAVSRLKRGMRKNAQRTY